MKIFRSFSGILVTGAIVIHLILTAILFSNILKFVENSYREQFIENARSTSNMLVNQSINYLKKEDKDIEDFLDELLLSGNLNYAEITLDDGTVYSPKEMSNDGIVFKEDFFFAQNNDSTYFISASIDDYTTNKNGKVRFGFDESLIQENIDTAYIRGIYLAVGYVVLVVILIVLFVPKFTYSLRLLKNAAHNIADGNSDESLNISTRIDEFNSVFTSLEKMRLTLVNKKKQVEKSEVYLRKIMDRMADAMIIMNKDMIIQSLNVAAEKCFGYQSQELEGKAFNTLLSPCEPGKSCTNCEKLDNTAHVPGNDNSSIECMGQRKNGLTFPVELYYSNFNYDNEKTIICNAHDLTDHKSEQDKLSKALAGAEAANNSKSVFLSSMSHELRTPLNAIIGYSEILLEDAQDNKDEMTSNDLKKIRNSGTHLLSLINNILDLSKIEAGKMELDIHEFNLSKMIEDVLSTTQPLVDKTGNKMVLNFNHKVEEIIADATKVKQVLINIIGNAAKFTKDGYITLSIKTMDINMEPHILFEVTDTGIGILAEDIEHLFQEFSQANAQVTTKFGGTGLGLTISRKFCRMMRGDITVQSEFGKGSTFVITLPLDVNHPV